MWGRERPSAAIAIANAAFADDDPRKFTRETVAVLREAADALPEVEDEAAATGAVEHYLAGELRRVANALEAYLPR